MVADLAILTRDEPAIAAGLDFLRTAQSASGTWSDFLLPAGESDEWVTAFVGLALAEAGDPAAQRAWHALAQRARPDGGWGYNATTPPDADSTLWGLQLARAVQRSASPAARAAAARLPAYGQADGGVATYASAAAPRAYTGLPPLVSFAGWTQSHVCVSAAAAHVGVGPSPALRTFLLAQQRDDGSWPAYWWFDAEYATAEAATALGAGLHRARAASWAAKRIAALAAPAARPPAFAMAHALRTLETEPATPAAEMARRALRDWQNPDGSWPASARLRVPAPDCMAPDPASPWRPWQGLPEGARSPADILRYTFTTTTLDHRRIYTTATVLRALAGQPA